MPDVNIAVGQEQRLRLLPKASRQTLLGHKQMGMEDSAAGDIKMPYLSVIAPFGFTDFNPITLLPLYRRLGCRRCQFYRNMENPPDWSEAKRIVEDAGMPFDSIHGVFGPEYDPSNEDDVVRRKAMEAYRLEGDLAVKLGGFSVVAHPAPIAAYPNSITKENQSARVDPMRKTMRELADIGQNLGVTYLIENVPANYQFGSDVFQLAQIVRELNHPNVRICFDVGHAHMTGKAPAALEGCLDVVAYLHVHDNDGKNDSHGIPGEGSLPWDQLQPVMAKAKINLPAMLELFISEQRVEQQIADGLGHNLKTWMALNSHGTSD